MILYRSLMTRSSAAEMSLLRQVALVAIFGRLVYCGIVKNLPESSDVEETSKITGDEESVICPVLNSEFPALLPHPDDCSRFYICDSGKPYLNKCPLGLYFNAKINACDYPKNTECDKEGEKKPKGKQTDENTGACPAENSEIPIYIPHPDECSKFYTCDNGTPHLTECQPGLHFNPKIKTCDYPRNAGCESDYERKKTKESITDGGIRICPDEFSEYPAYLPHPRDCAKFYVCVNGSSYLKMCPMGLHYNPKVKACDYPNNAVCGSGLIIKRERSTASDGPQDLCTQQRNGHPAFIAHSSDCEKFFICNGGVKFPLSCSSGLHFNLERGTCDYPENASCDESASLKQRKIFHHEDSILQCPEENPHDKPVLHPHPTDCDKFYICHEKKPVVKRCPAGTNFNEKMQACDHAKTTVCYKQITHMSAGVSSPFCPQMNGKIPVFFRHPSNCSIYYMCGNGLAYEFACPARLHFNLRKKVCDYEDKANCRSINSRT